MVDTDGDIVEIADKEGRAWARDHDGDLRRVGKFEIDYAHPSNIGHILAHVQNKRPGVAVGLYYHPDAGWCGEIDDWHTYGTLPDVLRAMVGRVSDV
jgi:hypothetical protein